MKKVLTFLAAFLLILSFDTLWAETYNPPTESKAAHRSNTPSSQPTNSQMANPASVNCTKQGGSLAIQKRGDGGEYGVCTFEENRQCEEWALFRGECPKGGVKITGYDSPDQIYCAILGGKTMAHPHASCSFKDGRICKNKDLFSGKCPGKP